jgi:hypothetical protein
MSEILIRLQRRRLRTATRITGFSSLIQGLHGHCIPTSECKLFSWCFNAETEGRRGLVLSIPALSWKYREDHPHGK